MSESFSESYKAAGVDVTAGYLAVELMKGTRCPHDDSWHVLDPESAAFWRRLFELDLTGIHQTGIWFPVQTVLAPN